MSEGIIRISICSLLSKCSLRDYALDIVDATIKVTFYSVHWYSFIKKRRISLFSFLVSDIVPLCCLLSIRSVSGHKPGFAHGKRIYGCRME